MTGGQIESFQVGFASLPDLASEKVGGRALAASDEFFAGKENLLKPGRGIFVPDKYTENGKWMDGWESRRKRNVTPGDHDWCVIRLGMPGRIRGIDVDTNHFLGNFPELCALDAVEAPDDPSAATLSGSGIEWEEIVPRSRLRGGSQNFFAVTSDRRFTHVRLRIYPDGGVARLRVHGVVLPDWKKLAAAKEVDLAALENGAVVLGCNDMFFGPKENLILPGRATNMGEGWETRRKRGPGHDWLILKLARPGVARKIEVDTNHFKGNYPDRCSIEGCLADGDPTLEELSRDPSVAWRELLPSVKLEAHTRHFYEKELRDAGRVSHLRLNIFPDGGVSRLRVYGDWK